MRESMGMPTSYTDATLPPTGDFFHEIRAAMARIGEMRIPAGRRAEHELDLTRITRGDGATNDLAADRDGLAAHGTDECGTASHRPLSTTVAVWPGCLSRKSAKLSIIGHQRWLAETRAQLVDRGQHPGKAQETPLQGALAGKVDEAQPQEHEKHARTGYEWQRHDETREEGAPRYRSI